MYYNDSYLLLVLVPMIIGIIAQAKVNSAFNRYSSVHCANRLTGAEAARQVLQQNGVHDVKIERVKGNLTDHYDPRSNVIRLSDTVYASSSVAAVGVAAHEAGHAVQYAHGYGPIRFRAAIIPVTKIGSNLAVPLVLLGLIFSSYPLALVGLIGYGLIAIFQLATLPVEFNASNRAMESLTVLGLSPQEQEGSRKVLSAAAMTYVAAMLAAVTQLMRMIAIVGRGQRRN